MNVIDKIKRSIVVLNFLRTHILFIVVLLVSNHAFGATYREIQDGLILHLDKPAYFIGETIWYKIYSEGETEAKAFYLELYDDDGNRIVLQKCAVRNHMSSGNLTLPNTLKTGRYALITSADRSTKGYRRDILIVNPQDEKTLLSKVPFNPISAKNNDTNNWDVKLELRNQAISRRGKIELELNVTDNQGEAVSGNFSVAIRDKSKTLAVPDMAFENKIVNTAKSLDPMVVKGKIASENGVDISDKMPLVLQVIVGNTAHSIITDKNGQFEIPIEHELLGTNTVYFMNYRYFIENGFPLKLEFINDKPVSNLSFNVLNHTFDLQNAAQKHLERQATLSSFFASGKDVYSSINQIEEESGIRIDHEPDRLVVPDNYETLPTMQEVFRELVGTVRVRQSEDGFTIAIRHQDLESVVRHQPLMLVDGQPETDLDKILELNPRELAKIEVFFSKEKIIQFGITGSNGILSITTKKGDYSAESIPTYEVDGFARTNDFLFPDFASDLKDCPTPDLRTLLYWNADIETTKDGVILLDFYNSDSLGDLEVEIFGQTDTGQILSKKTVIKGINSL